VKSLAVNISRNKLTNYKISKEKGLEIVKSNVKLKSGLYILYDSERNIKGENYHLYTVNTNEYTYDEYAYCVDVNSGKLFKCLKDMTLLPIS
jgi:predicted small secreted protein